MNRLRATLAWRGMPDRYIAKGAPPTNDTLSRPQREFYRPARRASTVPE